MPANVIELDGVGKRYRLGEHHGSGSDLRETLARLGGRLRGRTPNPPAEIWSLRDISVDVSAGQALGIVGANGAGKSTLLKIVSNITTPTEGECRTKGRIGSLLEVGTGFHGELTGLENTYLNGAILGMTRREVAGRLDEIVEFAGLERFMDTPVKRYSSGMYLRLGFSIAAHLEADILVVDEVLAVGDADFQRRCLGKMSEVEQSGRTVLFVSHNLEALSRLCPTALWLERGQIRRIGAARDVIDEYTRSSSGETTGASTFEIRQDASAQVVSLAVLDDEGVAHSVLNPWTALTIEVQLVVNEPTPLDMAVLVSTSGGTNLVDEALRDRSLSGLFERGRYRVRCSLPPILTSGEYTASVWLGSTYDTLDHYENAVLFTIDGEDDRPRRHLRLDAPWDIVRIE
jgi:ABC-2 type transport system ATP-binding protein/lipopolysaccharide transport system ATP-binding protein